MLIVNLAQFKRHRDRFNAPLSPGQWVTGSGPTTHCKKDKQPKLSPIPIKNKGKKKNPEAFSTESRVKSDCIFVYFPDHNA